MKIRKGKLVVFEGPDGVGKSALAEACSKKFPEILLSSFPGRVAGTVGDLIYRVHHTPKDVGLTQLPCEISLQALHVAAHLEMLETLLKPALQSGRSVFLDRFWWSTYVYGKNSGCDETVLELLIEAEKKLWCKYEPALVILLQCTEPFKTTEQSKKVWKQLHREYQKLANAEHELGNTKIVVVENNATFEQALDTVISAIENATGLCAKSQGTQPLATKSKIRAPIVSIAPAKPTEVYDTFWRFAVERQNIFFNRFHGEPYPWTDNRTLLEYKFTNAYRAADRVSQYLIKNVIYRDDLPHDVDEVFFRIMLFKIFNKIETWERFEHFLGPITFADYSFKTYDDVLSRAMDESISIYSAAYIMPSGNGLLGHSKKHRNHLELIENMMSNRLPDKIAESKNMQQAFSLLRAYPTIGDFLAYQFVTDINYSVITNFTEMEFVVPGPGSLSGIHKCFSDLGGLNEREIIKFITERQNLEFERLGLSFKTLWGRPLQLIDCQNLFCEVDKYSRVAHPEILAVSGRTKIKQRFRRSETPIRFWFPPKWKLNEHLNVHDDLFKNVMVPTS